MITQIVRFVLWSLCIGSVISSSGKAQDIRTFFSPGIKLGYVLGPDGGFSYGFEISALWTLKSSGGNLTGLGAVLDVDSWRGRGRIHVGVEGMVSLGPSGIVLGLDLGPSFVIDRSSTETGFSLIPFGGFLVLPYYHHMILGTGSVGEVGLYGKLAVQSSGPAIIH